ncbi:hypothetical protein ACJX0J_026639, partial [Zea mays]
TDSGTRLFVENWGRQPEPGPLLNRHRGVQGIHELGAVFHGCYGLHASTRNEGIGHQKFSMEPEMYNFYSSIRLFSCVYQLSEHKMLSKIGLLYNHSTISTRDIVF